MNKRILLISHCFAPQNKIGAVRPTKLAKYLDRIGYHVTVLCGEDYSSVTDPLLARDLCDMPDVHVVREKSLLRWWKRRGQPSAGDNQIPHNETRLTKARPVRNTLYLFLAYRADAAFARACIRTAKQMGRKYDVVLSTYGPLSSHTIAYRIKRLGMAKSWIADFRDEAAVPFTWQNRRLQRYTAMVRRHADAITSISAGCLRVMGLEDRGQVIHNGFDPDDLIGFSAPPKRTDKLAFIHCGQMYGLQRDLSPFFQALHDLIDEGKIAKPSVALVYAGKDTRGFVKQAKAAGLEACLEGYDFIPRDESLRLQKSAHILLLPAWNLKDRQGNIPGKLLEYMLLEMPVICCVSGDVPNSEVADIIRSTNIGICCEQANHAQDYPRLKAYIQEAIDAYLHGNPMPFQPNRKAINAFTCEGLAGKMANIIEDCTGLIQYKRI